MNDFSQNDADTQLPGTDGAVECPDQPAEGRLRLWHQLFHSTYQRHIDDDLAKLGQSYTPVLVRISDSLILFHQDHVFEKVVAGAAYHKLKTLCHIPIGLYLQFAATQDQAPSELDQFRAALVDLAAATDEVDLISACEHFIDAYSSNRMMSDAALIELRVQYNRAARLLVQRASNEAVNALDSALESFEEQVDNPTQWSELFCVVCSGHQPRYGELNKQYFRQYLQKRNIGDARWEHRLLYGEGISQAKAALRLVAQRRVDERIGTVLLGSSGGLNQDILAHAGKIALRRELD